MQQIIACTGDALRTVDHAVMRCVALSGIHKLLGVGSGALRYECHTDAGTRNLVHDITEIGRTGLLTWRRKLRRTRELSIVHQKLIQAKHRNLVEEESAVLDFVVDAGDQRRALDDVLEADTDVLKLLLREGTQ